MYNKSVTNRNLPGGVSKQTKSENQIIYICDFRRYEKSAFSNILL